MKTVIFSCIALSSLTFGAAYGQQNPLPIAVDSVFLFDRSGSFSDDIDTFRQVSGSMTTELSSRVTDLAIGLASFVDAPCYGFGSARDFGFAQDLSLTTDLGSLTSVLNGLSTLDGNDGPESQLEAMYQSLTGKGRVVNRGDASCRGIADIASSDTGWRRRTLKFMFVSTDSDFHKPTDAGYPYSSTADDVIKAALEQDVRIYFLYAAGDSSTPDSDAFRIAEATGGEVRKLSTDSREMPRLVLEIIERDAKEACETKSGLCEQ
jgi:hypothetical protein